MVEQVIYTDKVMGSNPLFPSKAHSSVGRILVSKAISEGSIPSVPVLA